MSVDHWESLPASGSRAVGLGPGPALVAAINRQPAALLDLAALTALVECVAAESLPRHRLRLVLHLDGTDEGPGATSVVQLKSAASRGEPIVADGGRVIGWFEVGGDPVIAEVDALALHQLASALAPYLDVAIRHAIVSRDAETDGLTGLANYRTFYRALGKMLVGGRDPVSVVLFDVDGMKQVNDVAGHLAGDALLRRFARMAMAHVRKGDVVARYGGDEFVLALADVSRVQAERIGRRIAVAFAREEDLPVGVAAASIGYGVATTPDDGCLPADLVGAADARLYASRARRRATQEASAESRLG